MLIRTTPPPIYDERRYLAGEVAAHIADHEVAMLMARKHSNPAARATWLAQAAKHRRRAAIMRRRLVAHAQLWEGVQ